MNAFDVLLVLLAAVGVFFGFRKGLMRILIGMAALVVAFLLASRLGGRAGAWLSFTGMSERVRLLVGYLLVFFGVMLVGGVLSWLARKLVKAAMLGWADRVAGGAAGIVVALVAAALLAYPLVAYAPGGGRLLAHSRFAPYVAAVADLADHLAPDDLRRRYHEGIEKLRKRWNGSETHEVVRGVPQGEQSPGPATLS